MLDGGAPGRSCQSASGASVHSGICHGVRLPIVGNCVQVDLGSAHDTAAPLHWVVLGIPPPPAISPPGGGGDGHFFGGGFRFLLFVSLTFWCHLISLAHMEHRCSGCCSGDVPLNVKCWQSVLLLCCSGV